MLGAVYEGGITALFLQKSRFDTFKCTAAALVTIMKSDIYIVDVGITFTMIQFKDANHHSMGFYAELLHLQSPGA